MAAARVVFHPGASDDYAAAFAWYYTRGTALASDFEREIERGIRLISQNPLRWPKFDGQRRRFVVRKFPYAIIYAVHCKDVVILPWATASGDPTTGAIDQQTNRRGHARQSKIGMTMRSILAHRQLKVYRAVKYQRSGKALVVTR